MSVYPRQNQGPDTVEVSAAVTGGQLVEPDGDNPGKVKPAAAGSAAVLGVALEDAQPAGSEPTNPINTGWPRPHTSVAHGVDVRVTYAAPATHGQKLAAADNGQVAPWDSATASAGAIVGICTEPAGVSGAGAVARARIY